MSSHFSPVKFFSHRNFVFINISVDDCVKSVYSTLIFKSGVVCQFCQHAVFLTRNKDQGNFAPYEFHDRGIQLQPNAAGPHKS